MFIRFVPSLQGKPSLTTAVQVGTGSGGGGGGLEIFGGGERGAFGGGLGAFGGGGGLGPKVEGGLEGSCGSGALLKLHFAPFTRTASGSQTSSVLWMLAPALTVLLAFGCSAVIA